MYRDRIKWSRSNTVKEPGYLKFTLVTSGPVDWTEPFVRFYFHNSILETIEKYSNWSLHQAYHRLK